MIFDDVFKAFNEYVDGLTPEIIRDLSKYYVLNEFKTLRFSYGRQTGVTTWICKQMKNYPVGESIMICPSLAMKKCVINKIPGEYSRYVFSVTQAIDRLEHILIFGLFHGCFDDLDFYDTLKYVFVDDSSLIECEDLKKLGELLSVFNVRMMLL